MSGALPPFKPPDNYIVFRGEAPRDHRFVAIDSLLTVPSPGTILDPIVRAGRSPSNHPARRWGARGAPFKPPDNMFFRYEAPRDPLWDF